MSVRRTRGGGTGVGPSVDLTSVSGGNGSNSIQVCLFGLGEAGSLLAADLVEAGADVTAYDPAEVATPIGVTRRAHPALALRPVDRSVDLILAATGGDESRLALLQAVDAIDAGTIYADVSTAAPGLKLDLADEAIRRDVDFVDVALLGMVPGHGLATPALASGPGANRLADLVNPLGASVEPITGPPGTATAKKLLRSVLMKGVAAVLIEATRAGAAADDLDWLWANVTEELGRADDRWARRLIEGSGVHARRRHSEMLAAVSLLEALEVSPIMTRATVATLRDLVDGAEIPELPGRSG